MKEIEIIRPKAIVIVGSRDHWKAYKKHILKSASVGPELKSIPLCRIYHYSYWGKRKGEEYYDDLKEVRTWYSLIQSGKIKDLLKEGKVKGLIYDVRKKKYSTPKYLRKLVMVKRLKTS